jgi:hypothetical protein
MVLGALILNSDASLNTYFTVASQDFVPGSKCDLVIQLVDLQKNLRYVPPSAATLSMLFNKTDGSSLNKSASLVDSGDRSMWKVTLSELETQDLLSGNFTFALDVNGNATLIIKGMVKNGLRSLLLGC